MADTGTPSGPGAPSTTTPRRITVTTPSRRAYSADPPTALRRSIRTPGSSNARPGGGAGLSASGRKNNPPTATTPHGRAAIRALDSMRAAMFTPGRRRRSLRDLRRETPRDLLRALSRNLAPTTEPVRTSSSPRGGASVVKSEGDGQLFVDDDYEEEEDDGPLRVPRMSLPIDEDDDDGDWPRPHRSAGLEDENMTVQSVEFGRRAYSEVPGRRSSVAGMRMSDVYGRLDDDDGHVEFEGFPPLHAIDEDAAVGMAVDDDYTYERLEVEAENARRDTGRESDFGLVVALPEGNDTTVVILPEVADEEDEMPEPNDEREESGVAEESHVHFADDVIGGQYEEEQEQDVGELDEELEEEVEEFTMEVDSATARKAAAAAKGRKKKAGVKVSKYGIQYPSLPPAVVKRLAQTFAKTSGVKGRIGADTLAAIMQASEWFFEQLGDDLQAYAKHAGRKTIDESDVLQVMKRYVTFVRLYARGILQCAPDICTRLTRSVIRQRQINSSTTPFSLAQRYLPRELLQELRMPPPAPVKKGRAPRSRALEADDEVT